MATFLYNDIETIPTQDQKEQERAAGTVKAPVRQTEFVPPSNYKDQAKIDEWIANKRAAADREFEEARAGYDAAVRQAIHKTCFDGGLGHIICIGWAVDDDEPDALVIDRVQDEADLLREFFSQVGKRLPRFGVPTWVGHNWIQFDARMIRQRAIVLGVELPPWFPRDPKPWGNEVHDLQVMWAGPRDHISLDRLARYLGVSGKTEGMDGSQVWDRWMAKRFELIAEYCGDDVRALRPIHRKILTAYGIDWMPAPVGPNADAAADIDDEVRF